MLRLKELIFSFAWIFANAILVFIAAILTVLAIEICNKQCILKTCSKYQPFQSYDNWLVDLDL